MAKKERINRKDEGEKTTVQASVVDEAEMLYTVGLWKGYKQFRCVRCPFDTLNEETMYRHLNVHRPAAPPAAVKPLVLVADKHGNEVDFVQGGDKGEGDGDVFEVELKEIDSTVDANGDVHKTFTVKE